MQPDIESLATRHHNFMVHMETQALAMRRLYTVAERHEAWQKLHDSPLVAKPGQQWLPGCEGAEHYMATAEKMCDVTPQNLAESVFFLYHCSYAYAIIISRIKIVHAANAGMACWFAHVLGPLMTEQGQKSVGVSRV